MNSDLPPAGGPHPASSPDEGTTTTTSGATTTTAKAPAGSGGSEDAGGGNTVPTKGIQDFFTWLRNFGIYRPDDGRWGAGVASGLSQRWGIDPILVRGAFVALAFAGGLGIAAYGILWLLMPQQDGRIHLQEAVHGRFSAGFVGAVLLSLALFGDPGPWQGNDWYGGPPRFLAVVFLVGLIWWMHRHQDPSQRWNGQAPPVQGPTVQGPAGDADGVVPEYGSPATRTASMQSGPSTAVQDTPRVPPVAPPHWTPRPAKPDPSRASKRITRITLGLALIVAAVIGISRVGSDEHPTVLVATAAALGVIAAGVIAAGLVGRRSGGLAFFGLVLAVVSLAGAGVHQAGVRGGQNTALAGDYSWAPASATSAERQFNLGVGKGELDLTDPDIMDGATAANPRQVSVRMGAGDLTVITPESVPAKVNLSLGAGQLFEPDGTVTDFDPGNHSDDDEYKGGTTTTTVGPTDKPQLLIIDIKQGAGVIHLVTESSTPSVTPSAAASADGAITPDQTDQADQAAKTKEPNNA